MKTREVRNAIPPEPPLRVLIFGAGVLGSLYGARLAEAGNDVAVLARGRRLGELRARGVVLEDVRSGARTATPVRIVSELAPDDPYDVVVVLVRKTQLASVPPPLAASRATPNVLVMVSNPSGPGELIAALGRERLLLGFAGAGGTLDQGVVRYAMAPRLFQPTTIGELDGSKSPRLRRIACSLSRRRAADAPRIAHRRLAQDPRGVGEPVRQCDLRRRRLQLHARALTRCAASARPSDSRRLSRA